MINFFKNRKKRKADKELADAEEFKKERELLHEILKKETESMTSKPCAINSMDNCSSTCVHFRAGKVEKFISINGSTVIYNKYPRCKLWQ